MIKKISLMLLILSIISIETVNALSQDNSSKEITISFVGDCTLGEYKGQSAGNQFKDYYDKYGANYFLENVKDIFESDDITFINLEGPLTNETQKVKKSFPIKGKPEYVNILKDSSVEVCNLSNNHIYDCGEKGFEETKQILDDNDINYCGEGNISTIEKDGVKVSFLGYRGFSDTKELRNKIEEDINYVKTEEKTNIVCVMFHFGEERKYESNKTQEDLAHLAIDLGADIVVGNHPHVIQGIEVYKNKTICYSLGNFSFGANKNPKDKDTFIFQQTFKIDDKGNATYGEYDIIPCRISSVTNKNDYKPTPLKDTEKNNVIDRLIKYSQKYTDKLDLETKKEL